jgi:hypothetical protein
MVGIRTAKASRNHAFRASIKMFLAGRRLPILNARLQGKILDQLTPDQRHGF